MTLFAAHHSLVDAAQATGSIAAILLALGVIGRALLGIYRIAKRVESTDALVRKELPPNGGTSLRDAIDRIEAKADNAVSRAEDAAHHAHFASQHAANALDRIERLEASKPNAIAIAVAPPADTEAED